MNEIFAKIFSKQPDEIINNDFYYNVNYFGAKPMFEELYEQREDSWLRKERGFKYSWGDNTKRFNEMPELSRICSEIAAEGKPF
jgi:hypothetical protein